MLVGLIVINWMRRVKGSGGGGGLTMGSLAVFLFVIFFVVAISIKIVEPATTCLVEKAFELDVTSLIQEA